MPVVLAQAQAAVPAPGWSDGPGVVRTILSLIVVLGLLAACLWLVRRGGWQGGRKGPRAVQIETAVGLGDRRQLVIVAVEGRRLLLGVTPMHVGLVTELSATGATFADALATRVATLGPDAPASSGEGLR
jgi:flagellar biosynthetic protein FliO